MNSPLTIHYCSLYPEAPRVPGVIVPRGARASAAWCTGMLWLNHVESMGLWMVKSMLLPSGYLT